MRCIFDILKICLETSRSSRNTHICIWVISLCQEVGVRANTFLFMLYIYQRSKRKLNWVIDRKSDTWIVDCSMFERFTIYFNFILMYYLAGDIGLCFQYVLFVQIVGLFPIWLFLQRDYFEVGKMHTFA